jgi:hypothetical protein
MYLYREDGLSVVESLTSYHPDMTIEVTISISVLTNNARLSLPLNTYLSVRSDSTRDAKDKLYSRNFGITGH